VNPYRLLDPAVAFLHHLMVLTAGAVPAPAGGVRFAVALALLTVATRILLLPLSVRALRAERARAALAPGLASLRRRHADDPRRLLAETSRLHREAGVSPMSGLGLGLLRLPVVLAVYRLAALPVIGGSPNLLLTAHLFGAPMAAHWPEVLAVGGVLGPVALLVLLAALTVLAALSSRAAVAPAAGGEGDGATAAVARVVRLMPYGTVVFAAVTPVAMGIYLLVSTAWGLAERRLLPRLVTA